MRKGKFSASGRSLADCLLGASAVALALFPVAAAAIQPNGERVFIGHLVSSTLTTVPPSRGGPRGSLVISMTCAEAATTYEVLAGAAKGREHMVVRSSLGEWCDMPLGMRGEPVLIQAEWRDGAWWETHALAFDAIRGRHPVLIPARFRAADTTICGVEFRKLETPLDPADQVMGDARQWQPAEIERMVARHAARIESDGTLFFTAGVRWERLIAALAETPCWPSPRNRDGSDHGT